MYKKVFLKAMQLFLKYTLIGNGPSGFSRLGINLSKFCKKVTLLPVRGQAPRNRRTYQAKPELKSQGHRRLQSAFISYFMSRV